MQTRHIATACLLNDRQEVLLVRKQNTTAWMLPGGKLEQGETAVQALLREVHEELGVRLEVAMLQPLGAFAAAAANEPDTRVQAQAFWTWLPEGQTPHISAEIAQMQWVPLAGPLPEGAAPLLREHIAPALRACGV